MTPDPPDHQPAATPDNPAPAPRRPDRPVLHRPASSAAGDRPIRPTRRPAVAERVDVTAVEPATAPPAVPLPVVPEPVPPGPPRASRRPVWRPTVLPSLVVSGVAAVAAGVGLVLQPPDAALRQIGPAWPWLAGGGAVLGLAAAVSATLRPRAARIDSPGVRSYDRLADSPQK